MEYKPCEPYKPLVDWIEQDGFLDPQDGESPFGCGIEEWYPQQLSFYLRMIYERGFRHGRKTSNEPSQPLPQKRIPTPK